MMSVTLSCQIYDACNFTLSYDCGRAFRYSLFSSQSTYLKDMLLKLIVVAPVQFMLVFRIPNHIVYHLYWLCIFCNMMSYYKLIKYIIFFLIQLWIRDKAWNRNCWSYRWSPGTVHQLSLTNENKLDAC